MKFLLKHNAYVNIPTHLASDPVGVVRNLPQFVKASPSEPTVLELPDDIGLDSVSRTWEPMDQAATDALARLSDLHAARQRQQAQVSSAKKAEDAGVLVVAPRPSLADVLDTLRTLPADERDRLLASVQGDEAKAKARTETMSGMQPGKSKA